MKDMKKIPWKSLALQIFYLAAGTFFHMFIRHKFLQVFEGIGIPIDGIRHLILETPLFIVGLCCLFLIFLLAWKYNYLGNRIVVVLINLMGLCWLISFFYALWFFDPITAGSPPLG